MPKSVAGKQQTKLTLNSENLDSSREFGLNVSTISDEALTKVVGLELARAWVNENDQAIEERRAWIDTHGTPLADIQTLKVD